MSVRHPASTPRTSRLILHALLIAAICFAFSLSTHADASSDTSQPENLDPANFLEFITELDGKCQNLSPGGKLRSVKNNHPNKSIKYRFKRVFSGKPQAGLVIGTLEADGKPVKLGCTRVDGREQSWEINIAKFVVQTGT